jgi:DNA-binding NtrC family response regulator
MNEYSLSIVAAAMQSYRFQADPAEMIRSLLHIAIVAAGSAQGICCLEAQLLGGDRKGEKIVIASQTGSPPRIFSVKECRLCISPCPDTGNDIAGVGDRMSCLKHLPNLEPDIALPVSYQNSVIGMLALTQPAASGRLSQPIEAGKLIAKEIAYHAKRYEMRRLAEERTNEDLLFIGASDAMRAIDHFVEKASQVDLPVLITGESGCKKKDIAYGLHFGASRSEGPFVLVNCMSLDRNSSENQLLEMLARADRGTLFFRNIDDLDFKLQQKLLEIFDLSPASQARLLRMDKPPQFRLLASASRSLDEMARDKKFCQPLIEKLGVLRFQVSPLRERKSDIRSLVEYFLKKYAFDRPRGISAEALRMLEEYDWPKNIYELERVIAQLAVLSQEENISLQDIYNFAPELIRHASPARLSAASAFEDSTNRINPQLLRLVQKLLNGEEPDMGNLHTGVRKAIEYMANHFQQDISLGQLARYACLSPSHLSCLLKKTFGTSFKRLLAVMRIEKAKRLLVEKATLSITEISSEVGYNELSHFERTFKQILNCTPREYRQMAQKPQKFLTASRN